MGVVVAGVVVVVVVVGDGDVSGEQDGGLKLELRRKKWEGKQHMVGKVTGEEAFTRFGGCNVWKCYRDRKLLSLGKITTIPPPKSCAVFLKCLLRSCATISFFL